MITKNKNLFKGVTHLSYMKKGWGLSAICNSLFLKQLSLNSQWSVNFYGNYN